MIGKRVDWGDTGLTNPGDYALGPDGHWHGVTPNGHGCNLALHEVIEHDDGTITVAPSIKVSRGERELWHGFLERGVWREC